MRKLLIVPLFLSTSAFAVHQHHNHHNDNIGITLELQTGYTKQDNIGEEPIITRGEVHFYKELRKNISDALVIGAAVHTHSHFDSLGDFNTLATAQLGTFIEHEDAGRLEVGTLRSAEDRLHRGAHDIAQATGGINGDWHYYSNINAPVIIRPASPQGHGYHTTDSALKIGYYTPDLNGFTAGISYTLDSANYISSTDEHNHSGVQIHKQEDVVAAGVNYEHFYKDWLFDIAVTGTVNSEAATSYYAGGTVSYREYSLAAGYGVWNDTEITAHNMSHMGHMMSSKQEVDGNYLELGVSYENAGIGVSLSYLKSELDNVDGAGASNELDLVSFGLQYKLNKKITPYAEANIWDISDNNADDGTAIILGGKITF